MPIKNFDAQVKDFNGDLVFDVLRDSTGQATATVDKDGTRRLTPVAVFLKDQLARAVGNKYPGDDALPFDQQLSRGELAVKLAKGGNIELSDEEIVKIKELAAKGSTILVVQQLSEALKAEVSN